MDHIVGELRARWQLEVRASDIHRRDVCPQRLQRRDDALGGFQRDFALGAGAAHEHGDVQILDVEWHGCVMRAGLFLRPRFALRCEVQVRVRGVRFLGSG